MHRIIVVPVAKPMEGSVLDAAAGVQPNSFVLAVGFAVVVQVIIYKQFNYFLPVLMLWWLI